MKSNYRKAAGMTLMELLTVMAIVGILAAIAFPAYQAYVVKTNRAAARACLAQYSQFLERYYTSNMTYAGAAGAMGCASESGMDRRYLFTTPTLTQRTYTIRATPILAQLERDRQCGWLQLTQTGARSSQYGTSATCW